MNDPMQDLIRGLPGDGPDPAWLDASRRQLLQHVATKRRRRRRATAGWAAALATTAAALVLLALLPTSTIGFAGVQRSIERARTFQFVSTLSFVRDGEATPLSTARSWTDRDLGVRIDIDALGMPLAQFWLPQQGRPVLVDHFHRAIVPIELPDSLDTYELLRLDPSYVVRRLGKISGTIQPIPPDGPNTPNNATGFRLSAEAIGLSQASTLDVWVDTRTQLPVRIYVHVPLSASDALAWQIDQFVWYQPIDPGLLLVDLPGDYDDIDPLIVPTPGEEPLCRTLKRFAQLKNGHFPATDMVAWEALAKMVTVALQPASSWRDLPSPMNNELGQREALGDAIAAGLFCFKLQESGAQPAYFGQTVHLGDSQTIMRWRLPDGSTRRINGRIEAETLP